MSPADASRSSAAICLPLSIRLPTERNSDEPPIAIVREPPVPSPVGTRRLSPWMTSIMSMSTFNSAATICAKLVS